MKEIDKLKWFIALSVMTMVLLITFVGDGIGAFVKEFYRDLPFAAVLVTAGLIFGISWWTRLHHYLAALPVWLFVLLSVSVYVIIPLILSSWFGGW